MSNEIRETLCYKLIDTIIFEAILTNGTTTKTLNNKSLNYLKDDINVWIRCGKWQVETVERVTRKQFDWD